MAYIVFMIGMRSGVGDTPAYIKMFDDMPSNITLFSPEQYTKDRGFTILSILFKQYIGIIKTLYYFRQNVLGCDLLHNMKINKNILQYDQKLFYKF